MTIRTYGLSGSGMDVDQMVKDLMKARRVQYDSVYKKKTQIEWKKADYNVMYNTVRDFRNTVFDTKLQSSLIVRKASSTNQGAVTATASSTAGNASHSIEVRGLAEGVSETSAAGITKGTAKDTLANQFGINLSKFDITVSNGSNSKTITVDPSQSIYEFTSKINSAGVNLYANYDATLDRVFLSTGNTGAGSGIDFSGSSAAGMDFITNKLKLNPSAPTTTEGVSSSSAVNATLASQFGFNGSAKLNIKNGTNTASIQIEATDSLSSLAKKINNATGVNASASFDSATGKFTIKTTSGTLDLTTGSDAAAVNLFTNKLNLTGLSAISSTGTTSTSALAAPLGNVPLATQFSQLAGSFELNLNDGSNATVKINLATDSLASVVSKINETGKAQASINPATGEFTVKAMDGKILDISASNTTGSSFLSNNLKLGTLSGIDSTTGVSSSSPMYTLPEDMPLSKQFEGLSGTFEIKVKIGSATNTVSINTDVDSLETLKDKLNSAGATASYDAISRKFSISASTSETLDLSGSDDSAVSFLAGRLSISSLSDISAAGVTSSSAMFISESDKGLQNRFTDLNGGKLTLQIKSGADAVKTIDIDTSIDTMDTFVAKLNAQWPGAASYVDGKLSLNTAASLDFSGSDPGALDFLASELNLNVVGKKGIDADLTLDGISMGQASNTFTVAGVTYTLNDKTPIGTPARVTVTTDVDKIVSSVKTFIDSYNKTLESINKELNETYYKDYLPLTTDEMADLKETQITTWNEKAHSGLLHNNQTLQGLVRNMRNNFTDAIAGLSSTYKNAASLGITTGEYTEGGKLYLDESVLKDALNVDPDVAYKIFGTNGNTTSEQGICSRLYDSLTAASDKIASEAGRSAATSDLVSQMGKQIDDYNKQLDKMSTRLKAEEARYYKQFDAMEVALNKMNQQSSWLSQQLGGQ